MKHDAQDQRIALFIDFENLVTRTGIEADAFDLQPALDTLLEKGKVVFRRAYADWTRFPVASQRLHDHGVELMDVPPSTRAGKNGADVRLVIDALELAYLREHIDTFVIASGDSDFVPLAAKLRENDRIVIGMAVKESTSPLFVKACDEFIYLRGPGQRRRGGGGGGASGGGGGGGGSATGGDKEKEKPKEKEIPEVAREATAAILARASGPVNPSAIKAAIVRKQPDFDERDHGFSSFSRLLEAMEKEGLLRREQGAKGQWYVLPA
ncbi:MAG TPA: NYN domain-containing protein [Anaeromyxobacteraceae bacterium]|nr:NYN domain-containing protein [Anaeromyxobacteraceae bacterium]